MNYDVEEKQIPSQNSLLYLLLTNDISLENPDFPNDLKDLNDEESKEIYHIRRRYTLGTSDVNGVNNRWRLATIIKQSLISEDLLEQTRASFDKLSTETNKNLCSGVLKNIYSMKRRLGILVPTHIFPIQKPLPYSTKRKRNNNYNFNNTLTESTGSTFEDVDQLKLGQYESDNSAVGRKRSYTLPHSSVSKLNRLQNEYLSSTSTAVLNPKCANFVLKFVVEQLKKISSFILENRDLYKIPLPDLTKIIIRLLLLEIADSNLNFSVIICHLYKNKNNIKSFKYYETNIPMDINSTKSKLNNDFNYLNSIIKNKGHSTNSSKKDFIADSHQKSDISSDFTTSNAFRFSNNSLNHVDFTTNLSQISEDFLSQHSKQESMDITQNLTNEFVKQDFKPINLSYNSKNLSQINPRSILSNNQFNIDTDSDIELADKSLPTLNFTEMVHRLIIRYQGFHVSRNEHNQLKLAILHMNGELSSITQKKLQKLIATEFPNEPLRYSKLLLSLYSLCSIDVNMVTKFFCPSNLDVTTFVLQDIKR